VVACKISIYASGVTLKYRTEVAGPMIALYAVIRLDQRFQIKSFSYDRSDPVIKNHNSADDATGASDIRPYGKPSL
jgi:hypothetical protein